MFLCEGTVELKKRKQLKKIQAKKKSEGAPGFEPGTSRSAVECSATELYPQHYTYQQLNVPFKVRSQIHRSHIKYIPELPSDQEQ